MMDHVVSVRPLLDMLSQGNLMRNVMGRFVQVMAVLVGFALLLTWIEIWAMIGTLWSWSALALTVSQVILLAAFFKIVQVIFVRGEDLRKLPESDFTMMSIFSKLVRLPGEVALVFFACLSIPAMLLIWTGGANVITPYMLLTPALMMEGTPIVAGVVAFITCWLTGFALWVGFSLLAEVVSALFSIAHDLRCTRRSLESGSSSQPHMQSHARAA